ncbi:hypothetical protein [Ralstonia sp.]|uniref:hypothetical protein n=1 Tax=Ralstonia sp. TaxID=54061 RepID=UPI0031D20F9E
MILYNSEGELCGYYREVTPRRRPWGLYMFYAVMFVLMAGTFVLAMLAPKKLEKEHVGRDGLFLDAVRVDCPVGAAYAHASECIRSRHGVGFFFVDDNGLPRVVPVVGVGRVE